MTFDDYFTPPFSVDEQFVVDCLRPGHHIEKRALRRGIEMWNRKTGRDAGLHGVNSILKRMPRVRMDAQRTVEGECRAVIRGVSWGSVGYCNAARAVIAPDQREQLVDSFLSECTRPGEYVLKAALKSAFVEWCHNKSLNEWQTLCRLLMRRGYHVSARRRLEGGRAVRVVTGLALLGDE
jgi:hypothetical protein